MYFEQVECSLVGQTATGILQTSIQTITNKQSGEGRVALYLLKNYRYWLRFLGSVVRGTLT